MPGKYESKQQKSKKPFYKRWWFWTIVVILLLGAFFGGTPDSATQPETAPTVGTTEAPSTSDSTLNAVVGMIEIILKDNYKNYEISSNDGMIIVNIWDDGIALASTMAANGDTESKAAWDTMVEAQVDSCKAMQEFVDTAKLSDVTVMLNVLNDLDRSKTLLSIAHGIIVYNAVNSKSSRRG